jgi:hypothetical protein
VLVQVVDPLDPAAFGGAGQRHRVEHRQVLDGLAQADAAGVRADRHAELGRQQQVGDVLVHPGHPAGVDLHDVQGPGLQQLLEHDRVGDVLAGGHRDRPHAPADRGRAQDVERRGRLLHPGKPERRQLGDPADRGRHVPELVRVDGQPGLLAHRLAGDRAPALVVRQRRADLDLHLAEAVGDRLGAQRGQLLAGIAEPAGAGGVGGVAVPAQCGDPVLSAGRAALEQFHRLVRGERVGQVAEVDQGGELRRAHLGEQQPQRLARAPDGQVPAGVEDRAGGHVHHAAGRAEPVQRAVADQPPPEAAEIGQDLVQVPARQERLEQPDRRELDVVAAPDGEREPVPGQRGIRSVGSDDHVRGGVVRRRVHRVRPGQRP